jgi:TetR/AcrR family transcriptional regulator
MARPVNHQKRREIATQAFQVVLERGAYATTITDIAKSLGMKRSTLYWYFSDLGSLFDAVTQEIHEEVASYVVQAMAKRDHPIDQLIAVLEAAVDFYEKRGEVLRGLIQLWAFRCHDVETMIERQRQVLAPQRKFLVQLVEQGVQNGDIRPCDVPGLVDTVLTLVDGTVFRRVTLDMSPDKILDFARKNLLLPLKISNTKAKP